MSYIVALNCRGILLFQYIFSRIYDNLHRMTFLLQLQSCYHDAVIILKSGSLITVLSAVV